jgi:hypothetical protein
MGRLGTRSTICAVGLAALERMLIEEGFMDAAKDAHLPLSALCGRLMDMLLMRLNLVLATLVGAMFGGLMYLLHRWIIAPYAIPWF